MNNLNHDEIEKEISCYTNTKRTNVKRLQKYGISKCNILHNKL